MKESRPTRITPPPRAVRVSVAPGADGHLELTVRVRPARDVDVDGGVFIDLIHAATDRATRRAERTAARSLTPRLAALARLRRKASQRIAPPQHLFTGQPEAFRSEIVLPPGDVAGWSWFARGRVSAADGAELRSKWTRVT